MENREKEGIAFERAMAERDITPTGMAKLLNVQPQRITHWKKRGVSARYAQQAATYLQVAPGLISKLAGDNAIEEMPATYVTDEEVKAALTSKKQYAAIAAIADEVTPKDAIEIAEYFLARAKAGLQGS